MEDQNSWKGHTFTLMIFGGIVVLCAIFFVLGMIVGRMQGFKMATVAAAEAAAKTTVVQQSMLDERSALRLPEASDADTLTPREPVITKPDPAPVRPTPKVEPPRASSAGAVTLQVGAWRKQTEAEKQLRDLKRKGFPRAFILAPVATESNPVYRVQVAASAAEADSLKRKLETSGYKPIIKR